MEISLCFIILTCSKICLFPLLSHHHSVSPPPLLPSFCLSSSAITIFPSIPYHRSVYPPPLLLPLSPLPLPLSLYLFPSSFTISLSPSSLTTSLSLPLLSYYPFISHLIRYDLFVFLSLPLSPSSPSPLPSSLAIFSTLHFQNDGISLSFLLPHLSFPSSSSSFSYFSSPSSSLHPLLLPNLSIPRHSTSPPPPPPSLYLTIKTTPKA